jgi:hypothetical protein
MHAEMCLEVEFQWKLSYMTASPALDDHAPLRQPAPAAITRQTSVVIVASSGWIQVEGHLLPWSHQHVLAQRH